jgi:AraC family transcriptional regulator
MGSLVSPSARAPDPVACRIESGLARQRPAHVIGQFWHQTPECVAHGSEGGVSAAIWGSRRDVAQEYKRPALDHFHVLSVRLQDFRAERWQDGRPIREEETRVGSSSLTFAGVEPRSVVYGSWRSLQVYLPSALLAETAQQADLPPLQGGRVQRGLSYDPLLHTISSTIVSEIEQCKPGSRLQLDALGAMLCVHLLRRAGSACSGKVDDRGGLARWQVKRAMDCIADRLEENLTLATLAEEVGLSQFHFARAFKQSTGLTPHRYLLHCRLTRAKELLARTEASVADIAARVGYSEATQLCRLFQAELALSPSAYRRVAVPRYAEMARPDDKANPARNVSS